MSVKDLMSVFKVEGQQPDRNAGHIAGQNVTVLAFKQVSTMPRAAVC
jgi:hypothetical protein